MECIKRGIYVANMITDERLVPLYSVLISPHHGQRMLALLPPTEEAFPPDPEVARAGLGGGGEGDPCPAPPPPATKWGGGVRQNGQDSFCRSCSSKSSVWNTRLQDSHLVTGTSGIRLRKNWCLSGGSHLTKQRY